MGTALYLSSPSPTLPQDVLYILSMPPSARRGEPFVFYLTPPAVLRLIPLAVAAFLLLDPGYKAWALGSTRLSAGFSNHPALWWLVVLLVGSTVFLVRLAFPPLRALSKLVIQHESVSFVPRGVDRRMGDQVLEAAVTSQSTEILLCRRFLESLADGYSLVVRGSHEPEREIRIKFLRTPDAGSCRRIAEGITSTTGLPVRLVTRRRSTDGTEQETEWIPPKGTASAAIAVAAVPFAGGIVVGLLRLHPEMIAAVGLALWLGQILVGIAYSPRSRTQTERSALALSTVASIFPFGAAYGLAVVATVSILRTP